jgi:hypothetical protein
LIFNFSPFETERALVASVGVVDGVEVCPKANGERVSANPKASARDRSVFNLVIEFELLIIVKGRRAAWSRPTVVEFNDELLSHVVCPVPANN